MKKLIIYLFAGVLVLTSCEKFLSRDPDNEIGSIEFMTSENDLFLYTNGFLQRHMPDHETLAWGDQYCDIIATRSSTQFLIGDNWSADIQGGWGSGASGKWSELRNVNYFLDNIEKARGNVSEEIYNHYEGVGRFWRAYFYFGMVQTFGDVPWYENEIDVEDTELLYKPRDAREFVMDRVLEDLNFAVENCSEESRFVNSSTLINRWTALALKSRICLFEGTYRKYHQDLGLTSSADRFLQEAVEASEELMENGPFSLSHSEANVATQYRSLFNSEGLNTTEVILGLDFETDVRMHSITWKAFSASFGNNWSLTQDFVNQYLQRDGSRFTDYEDYKTRDFQQNFENRDYRLQQTVISPDYQRRLGGVEQPDAPNFAVTLTGYQMVKWAIDDDVHVGLATSNNSIPMLRYAEVLLNYAEAKAELGQMTNVEWDRSIRLLRERAGVNGMPPDTYDPYLADYYLNQTTDLWILEVRRERAIELAFENLRYDDLMRWRMGELIERTWNGIYIAEKGQVYDLNNDGVMDVAVVDQEPPSNQQVPGVVYIVLGSAYRLSEGDKGNIEYGFNQNRRWLDKKYLRPIPTAALQINENLDQNPGWERLGE